VADGVDGVPNEAAAARSEDLTHRAAYSSSDPAVAAVDAGGRLLAVADGEATIAVALDGVTRAVPVRVEGVAGGPPVSFLRDVLPVLSKAGCNSGACHASQYGKGGFKLSVFGFDPAADRQAIVRDEMGRRIDALRPDQSLLLLKPTMAVPHGGNRRLEPGSTDYQVLRTWIEEGAPGPATDEPAVTGIAVTPPSRVGPTGLTQQLQVVATYSDGTTRDVTAWAKFDSMDESVATVTPQGRYQAVGRGQAPVMVRFEGQAAVSLVVVPLADGVELAGWVDQNFVDTHAAAKFRELGIEPSPPCDDATFLRRAHLDAIGTLPTVEEAVAFLDSADPDKRTRLVDRLLGLTGDPAQDVYTDEYAAYWSLKWSDLVRCSSATIGEQGMWALHNWIKESFRRNKPLDQFVRELVTARGSVYMNGPANYYRVASNPQDLAETTAQLFLGVRLGCARCHHHPFEKYGQEDYYAFAAFFARVGVKGSQEFGLFGQEQIVLVRSGGEVTHPRTGQALPPTPLEGEPAAEGADRRDALAAWLTAPDNPFFARNIANRYASYLLGRGLVEPVDDQRGTNPASNEALLAALSGDLVAGGYDVKRLIRAIMTSRLYQLDSQPTAANAADGRFYSHYYVRRLAAEPLLDAIDRACGTRTKFRNLPLGTRAIELPDADYPDYFLSVFGKPKRTSVCECERTNDGNLAQALHLLGGATVQSKLSDGGGRIARLLAEQRAGDEAVAELYLATLSRRPTEEELALCRELSAAAPDPRTFYEDLLWSLLNTKQFQFNR
jgi:hypothetical protein